MLYSPKIFDNEWFIKRKGIAFGIMWAGSRVSGLILPFILQWTVSAYGFRTALRPWVIIFVLLAGPFVYFVKPSLPLLPNSGPRRVSFAFLRTPVFWLLQAGNIIESLGFFVPAIYLPTYAGSLSFPNVIGTIVVSPLNSTSVISAATIGLLVNRLDVATLILISSLGATAFVSYSGALRPRRLCCVSSCRCMASSRAASQLAFLVLSRLRKRKAQMQTRGLWDGFCGFDCFTGITALFEALVG